MPAYARGLMTDAASAPPWLPAYLDGERAALDTPLRPASAVIVLTAISGG